MYNRRLLLHHCFNAAKKSQTRCSAGLIAFRKAAMQAPKIFNIRRYSVNPMSVDDSDVDDEFEDDFEEDDAEDFDEGDE